MVVAERDYAQARGFVAPPGYRRLRLESTLLYKLGGALSGAPGSAGGRGAGTAGLRRGRVRGVSEVRAARARFSSGPV